VKNIIDADGDLEQIASNVTPSSFGTGGWGALVEGARTNLLQRSEEFNNAYWDKQRLTVTANTTTAPDGTMTAESLLETTDDGQHRIFSNTSFSFTGNHALSFFVKPNGRESFEIQYWNRGSGAFMFRSVFNLQTLSATETGKIEDYGNGWFRCSLNGVSDGGNSVVIRLRSETSQTSYVGDVTKGIFIWGAQLEAGSFASSYIKTEGATATRAADVITKTGASDLIGQTEGWIYAEVDISQSTKDNVDIVNLTDGTADNRVLINLNGNDERVVIRGNNQSLILDTVDTFVTGRVKYLLRYSKSSYLIVKNGVILNNPSISTGDFNLTRIDIGSRPGGTNIFNDSILLVGIGKGTLTEAEAIALTTL
jgi:uncharacterized protein (UPF0333 family)